MSSAPLNEQLQAARLHAGVTVAELARRAGTSRSAIHAYETGNVSPALDTAERILATIGYRLRIDRTQS